MIDRDRRCERAVLEMVERCNLTVFDRTRFERGSTIC